MLRPVPARWFEVLVAHDDAAAALEALAATGAIELEVRDDGGSFAPGAELAPLLDAFAGLAARYSRYWPEPGTGSGGSQRSARRVLEAGLARLSEWQAEADPLVRRLQALELERSELVTWQALLERHQDCRIDFGRLRDDEAILSRRLYVHPVDAVPVLPDGVLARRFAFADEACLLVVGAPGAIAQLDRQAAAIRGRASGVAFPAWLEGRAPQSLGRGARRLGQVRAEIEATRDSLAELAARFELATTLADLERLRWFATHAGRLVGSESFARLTGWTNDVHDTRLGAALHSAGVRALLRFPPVPHGAVAPLVLFNPWWARPFEVFARAIGVPGHDEVDPSALLAIVVPLMFGYMFGDVGQGAVLVLAGIVLRGRFALAPLLVAGGVSAIAFGVLFGSLFALEDQIPAFWLHPLADPITVLLVPIAAGGLLLALGLGLNALVATWRGAFVDWLRADAGMLALYVGALAGFVLTPMWCLVAVGSAWHVAGHALRERRLGALPASIAGAAEEAFQLAVNTLSFARVGAFALAHAGLSTAVVALAEAGGGAVAVVVLMVGNLVIIVLEGLVVSVQTTRLVLFEFFIRFLRGEGRALRPLAQPRGGLHETPP
jgi:V/A-type H+-transporting ATPase subunit I